MTETETKPDEWMTLTRAKEILKVGPATLTRLIDSGRVGVLRVPFGRPRVRAADVTALFEASKPAAKI